MRCNEVLSYFQALTKQSNIKKIAIGPCFLCLNVLQNALPNNFKVFNIIFRSIYVANHKSAKKRIRQNEKRRITSKWKTSRLRTEIKSLRSFIEAGSKDEALKQYPIVQKLIAKLGKSSALNKATAARKTSRLAAQVAKL